MNNVTKYKLVIEQKALHPEKTHKALCAEAGVNYSSYCVWKMKYLARLQQLFDCDDRTQLKSLLGLEAQQRKMSKAEFLESLPAPVRKKLTMFIGEAILKDLEAGTFKWRVRGGDLGDW